MIIAVAENIIQFFIKTGVTINGCCNKAFLTFVVNANIACRKCNTSIHFPFFLCDFFNHKVFGYICSKLLHVWSHVVQKGCYQNGSLFFQILVSVFFNIRNAIFPFFLFVIKAHQHFLILLNFSEYPFMFTLHFLQDNLCQFWLTCCQKFDFFFELTHFFLFLLNYSFMEINPRCKFFYFFSCFSNVLFDWQNNRSFLKWNNIILSRLHKFVNSHNFSYYSVWYCW